MNPTKHATKWAEIAQLHESQVREYILTNHESLGWEASTKPLIHLIGDWVELTLGGSIIDYGCGLGRNTLALADEGFHVCAFDTEEMIARIRAIEPTIEDEREIGDIVLCRKYDHLLTFFHRDKADLILVSLVAQHMHPDDLREAFSQFPKMGRNLLVTGRDWNDFVPRDERPMATWELIDEALGDSMILAREEHGPDDHGTKLWTVRT